MPKTSPAATFAKVMSTLVAERQAYAARLAEIDGMFARYGFSLGAVEVQAGSPKAGSKASGGKTAIAGAAKRKLDRNSKLYQVRVAALQKARESRWGKSRAAKTASPEAKAPVGKLRKRRTYAQTSDQFILGLLDGGKTLSTAQINRAWKDGGRRGVANNTLTLLTQAKTLVRKDNKGGRGSVYGLA